MHLSTLECQIIGESLAIQDDQIISNILAIKEDKIASNQDDTCPRHLAMLVMSCLCHQA